MSDSEIPLKQGFLWFPPHGVLGQLKKSWQKKYCQLFRRSKTGVDRLEVFDSEEDVGRTSSLSIIPLENCIKISQDAQKHQPHVFVVITKCNNSYFSANSDEEMNEWISAFQAVAFKDNISRQTIEEDNDLYCSSGDAGVFLVKLASSEASNRCGLNPGNYTLLATPTAIQLLDPENQQTLYTWPYRYIRRYGYRNGKFSFEAGRKCETGEGVFMFEYSREIFRCIATRMKNMKKLLNSDSVHTHTHSFLCGDNQLQAALSMVPGTRSPLPPSPTSATPLPDNGDTLGFPLTSYFGGSTLGPFSLNGGGSYEVTNLAPPLMPKPIFQPVARKVSPSFADLENGFGSSEEMLETLTNEQLAYDDVEVRNEAWRTMGVEVVNQPNVFKTIPMQTILSQTSPSPPKLLEMSKNVAEQQQQQPSHAGIAGKVIFAPANNTLDYHRLQHFGPTTKPTTATGYQHISLLTSGGGGGGLTTTAVRVEDEPIFACRRADDFKGYGTIRKKSSTDVPPAVEDLSKPFLAADLKYGIIFKPERV